MRVRYAQIRYDLKKDRRAKKLKKWSMKEWSLKRKARLVMESLDREFKK